MSYQMFLVIDGQDISIPVLPEKLSIQAAGKNEKTTVINLGEINILNKKGLKEVSWDSFFPVNSAPYVTGTVNEPIKIVKAIEKARDKLAPIHFLLLGCDLDINLQFGIDSFDYEERAGEVGDIYYDIKLVEWKNYSPKKVVFNSDKTAAQAKSATRSGSPKAAKTHTVIKGDYLWTLAKKYYNDGNQYSEIYKANKTIIDKRNKGTGNTKYTIYPGQVFTLP